MRKYWLLGIIFLLASSAGADYGDFFVAPDGDDGGVGSIEKPFATVMRARDAVRELVAEGLERDVTVLIRRGTYYLSEGIVFEGEDSGTEAFSISYMAYPGERARLVGGVEVEGWKRYEGEIFVADIPEGVEAGQVFEDGVRLTLARAPDEGYFHLESVVEGKVKTAFVYREEDLDLEGVDLSGAQIFIWPGHDWFSQDKPVGGVDADRRIIEMVGEGGYDMRSGNRFFAYNALAFLDRPGECVIDAEEGKVYVWPREGEIGERKIVLSTGEYVIGVHGTEEEPVRNLHFAGLDVAGGNGDVVEFTGVEDCSIRFCLIENGKGNGVEVYGWAQRVRVYGNEIREHGQHGVALQGMGPPGPDVNFRHVVENNHIHHCGRLVGHGYGVRIGQSGKNRVIHNHIHHMPRYATTIKGIRYQSLREQVEGVTFENRHDFLHSRENLIAYNDIHDVNMDSQDTGAMESWGPGRDNVYDHNLIHDVGNDRFNLQSGIYLDDASDYFTVTNNIIYGVVGTGGDQCIFAKGIGNRIENNVLVVGRTNVAGIRSMEMGGERCDGHVYARNIVVFDPPAEPPEGGFGERLRDLHGVGTVLEWEVEVPGSGEYGLWLRYTTSVEMGGKTAIAVDGGKSVALVGLGATGGWDHWEWRKAATLKLAQGKHALRWVNVEGGGIDLDALVLCDDAEWQPEGVELAAPGAERHMVVIQAEWSPSDRRVAYGFINWSEGRIDRADGNLFWNGGRQVMVEGGPGSGALARWQKMGFDVGSAVADPLFVDVKKRDFRLRRESPALKMGIVPIEIEKIGLKEDFPRRLAAE
jgi:hypothetical protein